jgi:hypothetical protein
MKAIVILRSGRVDSVVLVNDDDAAVAHKALREARPDDHTGVWSITPDTLPDTLAAFQEEREEFERETGCAVADCPTWPGPSDGNEGGL